MASNPYTELVLPNDLSFLRVARTYARELAGLAGLPPDDVDALVLAVDEACTNTIEHAFEPGESGTLKLAGELTPRALTLAIHDRGLPFDASLVPAYTPPQAQDVEQASARGLGLYLIGQAVDEARWISHGLEGKELRLVKYRPQTDVTRGLAEVDLAPFAEDAPLAPPQTYTVRHLRPEEAIQVSRCIYRTYGYTYTNEDVFYPERIAHLNQTGELFSAVALDEAGEVVGHYALERPDLGRVAELGQAVVIPTHRGRGLMGRMAALLEEEAHRLGLVGLFIQPVTSHPFSQRATESLGLHVCGVNLGFVPRSVNFKHIRAEPLAQRESLMLYFKYLVPPAGPRVYAPPQHREMLARIYAHLDCPVDFATPVSAAGAGQVDVSFHRPLNLGMIRAQRVGADGLAEIRRALRDLCEVAGAEVVYLDLPLAQPGTADLCRAAEDAGFFFSGLGPCFAPDGDVLRLQYLNTALDPARLQVASPFGQALLAYVVQEQQRVSA